MRLSFIFKMYVLLLFRFHLTTQTVQENQPMLVNQYYKVETNIFNNFDICLQNVGISINLPTNLKNMGKLFYKFLKLVSK